MNPGSLNRAVYNGQNQYHGQGPQTQQNSAHLVNDQTSVEQPISQVHDNGFSSPPRDNSNDEYNELQSKEVLSGINTGHTNAAYDPSNDYGNSDTNTHGWELKAKKHKTVPEKRKRRETSKKRKYRKGDTTTNSEVGTSVNDVATRYFNQQNKRKDQLANYQQ
mgnify:CR=1 FL=1